MNERPRLSTRARPRSDNRAGSYRYEIVTDSSRFLELRDEWDQLHAADSANYLGQTHAWTRISWETTVQPKGGRMFCLTERRGGRLVLAWPLAVQRQSAWSIVRPLNSQTSEYTTVLVDPTEETVARVCRAWRFLLKSCGCDLISLPNVHADSALGRVLAKPGLRWRQFDIPAPWLSTRDFPDWDAYLASVNSRQRSHLRRKGRRLQDLGEVRFDVVTDPVRCIRICDWMLAQKRNWMERQQLESDWIFSPEYRKLLEETFLEFSESSNRVIFTLTVGDQLVAAELCSVDRSRLEGFLGAHNPAFHKHSPGHIIKTHCLRWAHERGLDFDMRLGNESWKTNWTNRSRTVIVYLQAVTAWGAAYVAAQAARQRIKSHLPPVWRDGIDSWAARFTSITSEFSPARAGRQGSGKTYEVRR